MITKFNTYINEAIKSNNIFYAAEKGDLEFIKNYKGDINTVDTYGRSALQIPSYKNKFDIVKYLVEHGADVNNKDNINWTPLMSCAKNTTIVKYLIKHGADINIRNKYGYSAYIYNKYYFDSYEFQSWYMNTIGDYVKLKEFTQGNINDKIKNDPKYKKYIELDQLGII